MTDIFISDRLHRRLIVATLCVGIIARVVFALVGAPIMHGDRMFIHGDTMDYVNASINLVDHGVLDPDPGFPEAKFARVPFYSLAWAGVYAVAGQDHGFWVMAVIQLLVDLCSLLMMYEIGTRLGGRVAGLFCGLLFAVYPFELVWLTTSLPDVFTTFFTIAIVWATVRAPWSLRTSVLVGVFFGLAMLTREYLAPMIAVAGLYVLLNEERPLKHLVVVGLCAALVFSPWPARNYLVHGEPVLLRSPSSGSRYYDSDARAVVKWITSWTNYANTTFDLITRRGELGDIPDWVFVDEAQEARARALAKRAHECGSSFVSWRHEERASEDDCNDEVAQGFLELHEEFRARHPVHYWIAIPAQNVGKVLFKSSLVETPESVVKRLLIRALFLFRTLGVLLGLAGMAYYWRDRRLIPLLMFLVPLYGYMCVFFRGVQIRYLLQADLLLLIPAAMILGEGIARAVRRGGEEVEVQP